MGKPNTFNHPKFGDLPEYYGWTDVPKNFVTEIGLKERGKRRTPLQRPVAVVYIQRHRRHRHYLLYDVKDAIEKRPLTSRQKTALQRVKARHTCRRCGTSFVKLSAEGYCPSCQRDFKKRWAVRVEAVEWARSIVEQPFVILDTETTGLGGWDRIVEIAVIDRDGHTLIDTLIHPEMLIPADVINIHGITNDMVRDAPTFWNVLPQLEEILAGKPVVVYNAAFDTRFLGRSGLQVDEYEFHCAMLMYAKFFGKWSERYNSWRRQSLERACSYCGVEYNTMHRAVYDCEATRRVVQYMARTNIERR